MRWFYLALILAVGLGAGGLVLGSGAAQQTTPAAEERRGDEPAHPVAFHTGSCQRPSEDAAYTLGVVGPQQTDEGQLVGAEDIRGRLTTPPILEGNGTVDAPLEELLDENEPYVLAVHESAEAFGTILACGEVAGALVNDQITLALRPVDDSDYAGVAALGATDEDGTAGTVILFAEVDAFAAEDAAADEAGRRGARGGERGGNATRTAGAADQGVTGGVADEATSPADGTGADGDDGDGARRTRTPRDRETPTAPDATGTEEPTGTAPDGTETPDAGETPTTEAPAETPTAEPAETPAATPVT